MKQDVQVVLKVSERCNINCSYCYYLNSGNDSPHRRPAYISDDVVRGIVRFVRESHSSVELGRLRVVLHGGEPLMLKKARFRAVCAILQELADDHSDFCMALTTNAMLVDEEWLEILEEFGIRVCVSIDGPRDYHDQERVDFRGKGTYERVLEGTKRLKDAASQGRIAEPSVLAVIDPRFKGEVVYDHLIRQLGFRVADFLVPMTVHDGNPLPEDIEAIGRFLVGAFNEWTKDDDPQIQVRILNKYLTRLLGRSTHYDADFPPIVVGVGSDGTMVNDDLMQVLGPQIFDRALNVRTNTLAEYLLELRQGELAGVYTPHSECTRCQWFDVCRPPALPWGGAELRYSRKTGFQNKLVHCQAFQQLFRAMQAYAYPSVH